MVRKRHPGTAMFDRIGDGPITVRTGRYYDRLARQLTGGRLLAERGTEWFG
jgi:hypothetical protein